MLKRPFTQYFIVIAASSSNFAREDCDRLTKKYANNTKEVLRSLSERYQKQLKDVHVRCYIDLQDSRKEGENLKKLYHLGVESVISTKRKMASSSNDMPIDDVCIRVHTKMDKSCTKYEMLMKKVSSEVSDFRELI